MIKAIIFDIGGVVYKGTYEDFIKNLSISSGVSTNKLNSKIDSHIEALLIGVKSFFEITNDLKISRNTVIESLKNTYILDSNIKNLINKLRKTYKIACLSNAMDIDIALDEITELAQLFSVYINSCQVGIKKPDSKIYRIVLEKLKCKPDECVFIDDKEKYTKVGREMGLNSILFENYEHLISELTKLQILDL